MDPLGPSGGYAEYSLGGDDFDVRFKGNPLIEPAKVKELLLIRYAEVTLKQVPVPSVGPRLIQT